MAGSARSLVHVDDLRQLSPSRDLAAEREGSAVIDSICLSANGVDGTISQSR